MSLVAFQVNVSSSSSSTETMLISPTVADWSILEQLKQNQKKNKFILK